jgi:hypothetical protein
MLPDVMFSTAMKARYLFASDADLLHRLLGPTVPGDATPVPKKRELG